MENSPATRLVEIAHAIGSHPARLTLGSEGSCALRVSDDEFLVTRRGASLARLAEADVVTIGSAVARRLLELEELPEEGVSEAVRSPAEASPSTDMLIYAQLFEMDGLAIATHTQPVEINQIISSPRARQFADRRTVASDVVACGGGSVLVPFADPGLALAKEVKRKIMLWRDRYKLVPKLLLLQSHGMMVSGNDLTAVMEMSEMMIKSAQVFIGSAMMGGPMFLSPNHVASIEAIGPL